MKTRVSISVELYDDTGTSERAGGETLRWNQSLSDDNPRYSAGELENAMAEGTAVLVGKVSLLRGDIRVDRSETQAGHE